MYALDKEGRCVWVNQAGIAFSGYREQELLGRNWHELVHHHRESGALYLEADCPLSLALRTGEAANTDNDVLWDKQGQALNIRYVAAPVQEEGLAAVQVVSFIDITKRREVERVGRITEVARVIAVACIRAEDAESAGRVAIEEIMRGFDLEAGHCAFETAETGKVEVWRDLEETNQASGTTETEDKGEERLRRKMILMPLPERAESDTTIESPRTRVSAPLMAGKEVVGLMEFVRRGGSVDNGDLQATLSGAAAQLSWTIEREVSKARLRVEERKVGNEMRELAKANRDDALLREMNSLLDGARDEAEILAVVSEFGSQLFGGYRGMLALLEAGKGDLRLRAGWGEEIGKERFMVDACWSLRRGRLHSVEIGGKLYCEHLSVRGGHSVCVPLYSRGEVLGVLSLYAQERGEDFDELALRASESLSGAIDDMKTQEMLWVQKTYDALTGLGNLKQMDRWLQRAIERRGKEGKSLAVLVVEMEGLEALNVSGGKELGDIALKVVSTSLGYQIGGRDVLCRTGGDEFAIVLPETSPEMATTQVQRMRERLARLRVGTVENVHALSVNIGTSFYREGESARELIERARADLREKQGRARSGD